MNQRTFGRRQASQTANTATTGNKWLPLGTIGLVAVVVIGGLMVLMPNESAPVAQQVDALMPSHWVTSQRLPRYTCPSSGCGVVGDHYYRQGLDILEERNGFARVTEYYDASCTNGRSDYVDSGPAGCTNVNGIENGQFAEWVELSALSTERPVDPGDGATGTEALVADSDDFNVYRAQFVQAAEKMIAQGMCTAEQFREIGGFWYAPSRKPDPVYFIWCGDVQYYLDASTGEIWRR